MPPEWAGNSLPEQGNGLAAATALPTGCGGQKMKADVGCIF